MYYIVAVVVDDNNNSNNNESIIACLQEDDKLLCKTLRKYKRTCTLINNKTIMRRIKDIFYVEKSRDSCGYEGSTAAGNLFIMVHL